MLFIYYNFKIYFNVAGLMYDIYIYTNKCKYVNTYLDTYLIYAYIFTQSLECYV
jgi:hypothetical protein